MEENELIPNEELAKLINDWFLNIRSAVKVVKEKDANLYKMNNELQSYRNDYTRQLFKSLSQNIINFREDCKKSLRDTEEYELKKDAVVKYIGYVEEEYQTLLENLGVEVDGGIIKYNGKEINCEPLNVKLFEMPENQTPSEDEPLSVEEVNTQQDVIRLLDKRFEQLKALLKDNSLLDNVVGEYIKQSQLIERNEQQIVLYPVIRELVNYSDDLKGVVSEVNANLEEDTSVLLVAYKDILGQVINKMEDVLNLCQVTIEHALAGGDAYDPKRHRIMKFVPISAEEADKNGKIVKIYSDLYKTDDKVFYPAKVDVYKIK